jgi:hypothetical protein
MRVRLFVLEGGTVIQLTLTNRLLVARVLPWLPVAQPRGVGGMETAEEWPRFSWFEDNCCY